MVAAQPFSRRENFPLESFGSKTSQIAVIQKFSPVYLKDFVKRVAFSSEREKKQKTNEAKPISSSSRWRCCFGNVLHH